MRLILFSLFLVPLPAVAAPIGEVICTPTSEMVTRLEGYLGSERTAQGMRNENQIMEVWTDKRGDWAMVVRYSSGKSCIIAMGEHWHTVTPDENAS